MANNFVAPAEIEMKAQNLQSLPSSKTSPQVLPLQSGIPLSIHDEMKQLKQCFQDHNPITITTPFKGTALAITKDESRYIFSSKESRIAVCDSRNRRLVLDKQVKEKQIWTLALCQNDSVILAAGTSSLIRKLSYPSLKEIDTLQGHSGEINYVLVSHDDVWVFSCGDDGTVRKWPLNENSPKSQILYNHNGQVFGMGLSTDSALVATAGSEGALIVYRDSGNLTEAGTVLNTLRPRTDSNDSLWICRFSPDSSLVVAGSEDKNAYVWSIESWQLIRTLSGHIKRVRCMNFSKTGHILITGGIDSMIRVWDMVGKKDSVEINYHSDWVRATIISESGQFCTSLGDDTKIIRWKIPNFDQLLNLQSDASTILAMWITSDSSRIFSIGDNYLIRMWDTETGLLLTSYLLNIPNILHFTIGGSTRHFYIYTKESSPDDEDVAFLRVQYLQADNGQAVSDWTLNFFEVCSSYATPDGRFVVIGTKYTVDVYDSNFKLVHNFRNHSTPVIALRTTTDSRFLFTGSEDGEMLMSSIEEKKVVRRLLKENLEAPVLLIRISNNNETLMAIHALFVSVFSISKQSKIMTISEAGIKNISFSENHTKAFFFERNSLTVYNMDNFSMYYRQVFQVPTSYVSVAPNKKFWVLYRGAVSKIVPNHLHGEQFEVVGKRGEEVLFKKYVMDIIRDKEPKQNKNYDKWIILPNGMNTTHFYAYYNMPAYLLRAYEEGAPFFPSNSGHTALSIALELKYLSCVRAIIKGLTQSMKSNSLTLFYFDRSLTQLNDLGYSGLHRIYEYMFNRSVNRSLPKFSLEKPGQIYVESPNLIPDKLDFMPEDSYSTDGISIVFQQAYCRLPLVSGSDESLELIRSLIECSNNKIYDTEIIKLLLDEKWRRCKWIMIGIAAIFFAFSILLAYHTIVDKNDKSFIFAPFIVECVLVFYEIIQMFINKAQYFKDYMNWVDLIKTVLFMIYFILVELDHRDNNRLLAIVLFITLFRGLSFFRIFGETRKYINLLYEVIIDLIPFLIIFYYSTVGFNMIFLSLGRSGDSDFFTYVTEGYPTDLGGYSGLHPEFDKADWLNFFLATMLISIVMLSLVVSILSDTYARVSSHAQVADSQALAQMIYECELLYFWNRSKSESKFVFLCAEQEDPTLEKVDVLEKVGKLKTLVTALAKKINNNRRVMRRVKTEFGDKSEKIISSLSELS